MRVLWCVTKNIVKRIVYLDRINSFAYSQLLYKKLCVLYGKKNPLSTYLEAFVLIFACMWSSSKHISIKYFYLFVEYSGETVKDALLEIPFQPGSILNRFQFREQIFIYV